MLSGLGLGLAAEWVEEGACPWERCLITLSLVKTPTNTSSSSPENK